MMAKHEKRNPKEARGSRGAVERTRGATALRARRDEKRGGNAAPWEAWKTEKTEFPTLSTGLGNPAQKQRRRIPTFPPRRRRDIYLSGKEKRKTKAGTEFQLTDPGHFKQDKNVSVASLRS
ncbi:MAG TPA: hypothetical protein VNG91_02970 [Terriglobia bacterium]|nr:hypothetical protein [Terriglobia bacterium]